MAVYGVVSGFYARYPAIGNDVNSATIWGTYLPDASNWIETRLGGGFTLPFTPTNETVLRLVYLKALHLHRVRTRRPEDSAELGAELEQAITDIRCGVSPLVLSSGETLFWSGGNNTQPIETAFSTQQNYNPIFSVDDPSAQTRDSQQLADLRFVRTGRWVGEGN